MPRRPEGLSPNYFGWPLARNFVAIAMCLLAMLKLQDVDRFAIMFLGYDLLARRYVPYAYSILSRSWVRAYSCSRVLRIGCPFRLPGSLERSAPYPTKRMANARKTSMPGRYPSCWSSVGCLPAGNGRTRRLEAVRANTS
jgi:hypothetical protein